MSLNWTNVKSLAVPVGGVSRDVKRVSIGGAVVWEKPSPLPYDAEVEYLESTGTQWIDTGVVPAYNIKVDCTFATTADTSAGNRNYVLGAGTFGNGFQFSFSPSGFVGAGGSYNNTLSFSTDRNAHRIVIEHSAFTLDGSLVFTGGTSYNSGSFWLFGARDNTLGKVRVYSCKIWDNGILVRDLIPVRVGTTGYLYDRVSGKLFGNAGTGDFVVGPDIVPVEWLYSAGRNASSSITGPYIDIGLPAGLDVGVQISARISARTGKASMLTGSFVGANSGYWGVYKYDGYNYKMWGGLTKTVAINNDDFYLYSHNWLNSRELTIDKQGERVYSGSLTGTPTFSTGNIWMFLINKGSYNRYENETTYIKSAKYSIGSDIVRNFQSIRVGTEGAMMDTLTRRIYRNAGSGAFSYGADLPYPIGGN